MIILNGNIIIVDSERATLDDKMHFERAVITLIQSGTKSISIDLSKTVYLPSEMMDFMMWKKKELVDIKIDFKISAINSSLKKIFDNAMLSQFFEIDMNTDVTE
ncbi:MAG: hypothetical protein KAZ87_03380 [Spirochaetes bacterium]|nr:hypothetical protein [Spirochaetota bacterium]